MKNDKFKDLKKLAELFESEGYTIEVINDDESKTFLVSTSGQLEEVTKTLRNMGYSHSHHLNQDKFYLVRSGRHSFGNTYKIGFDDYDNLEAFFDGHFSSDVNENEDSIRDLTDIKEWLETFLVNPDTATIIDGKYEIEIRFYHPNPTFSASLMKKLVSNPNFKSISWSHGLYEKQAVIKLKK